MQSMTLNFKNMNGDRGGYRLRGVEGRNWSLDNRARVLFWTFYLHSRTKQRSLIVYFIDEHDLDCFFSWGHKCVLWHRHNKAFCMNNIFLIQKLS